MLMHMSNALLINRRLLLAIQKYAWDKSISELQVDNRKVILSPKSSITDVDLPLRMFNLGFKVFSFRKSSCQTELLLQLSYFALKVVDGFGKFRWCL